VEYKLYCLKISQKLNLFASKKIKQNKIYIPVATKNNLKELAVIAREIREGGLPKYLVRMKLKGRLGYGIFLHPEAKPIMKGGVIAPYSGEVMICPQNQEGDSDYLFALIPDLLLTKQEQTLLDPKSRYHPRRLYSIDLDADKKGNFTRFINHSTKPNVEAHLLRIPANAVGLMPAPFEIIYFAKKMIRPGQQLLVSYEGDDKSYWGALKIKPFPMTPNTFQLNASLQIVRR
jgi:hypothetical protein